MAISEAYYANVILTRKMNLTERSLRETDLENYTPIPERESRTRGKFHLGNLHLLHGQSLVASLKNCRTGKCLDLDTPLKIDKADTCTLKGGDR